MAGHVLEFAAASGLERQRLEGLRDVLDYVKHESPLYGRKLKGVDLRSIQTLEDVARLPFTTRGDLQDAAPFGSLCRSARPEAYYESSGTSGAAVPGFPDLSAGKARSFAQFLDIWLGLSRSKVTRALVAFAYEMNPAGVRFQTALPYVGVMAIPVGVRTTICSPEKTLDYILRLGPQVISGRPLELLRYGDALAAAGTPPAQPQDQHGESGAERDGPAHGQPRPDRHDAGGDRPDDRHELDETGEGPDQEPVGLAVEPEREGEQDRDDHDEEELPAHEGSELLVDQHPGVPRHPPLPARHHRLDERDRPVALEDPVGADGEHEQDSDEDLEQRLRHGHRGVEEACPRRELSQPLVDRAQDLVPEPVRVCRRLVERLLRGRHVADRVVDLSDRHRDDEVEEDRDRGEEAEVMDDDADGSRQSGATVQPLDARPHGRGDHEAEEEQRDHDPELPERDCCDDDRERDDGRYRRAACGSADFHRDSRVQLERSGRGYARPRGAPARDRPRAAFAARTRPRAGGRRVLPRSVAGGGRFRGRVARTVRRRGRTRGRPLGSD